MASKQSNMKKILYLLLLSPLIFSCSKEEETTPTIEDSFDYIPERSSERVHVFDVYNDVSDDYLIIRQKSNGFILYNKSASEGYNYLDFADYNLGTYDVIYEYLGNEIKTVEVNIRY